MPNCKKIKSEASGFPYFGLADLNLCKKDGQCNKCVNPVIRYKRAVDSEDDNNSELQNQVLMALSVKDRDRATELIVENIKDNNHIYTTRDDVKSEMWIYSEGIYVPQGKSFVREFTRTILGEAYTIQLANAVISKIEADTFIEHDEFFNTNHILRSSCTEWDIKYSYKRIRRTYS